jgi:hypothetical protein
MAGVLIGAGLLAACSGDEERVVPDSGSTWLDLLLLVPDTAQNRRLILMGDVAEAAEVRDVEVPAGDETGAAVLDYYEEVAGWGTETWAALPIADWMSVLEQDDEIRTELGFSYAQVDAFLTTGEAPDTLDVFLGRFSAAEIDSTLAEVPYWSGVQAEAEHGGVSYYQWLGDLENDYDHTSPARPLGHGGRMWVSDDHVVRTRSDAMITGAIDAASGADSLGVDEAYRGLAEALDQPGLYGGFLTGEVIDGTDGGAVLGFGAEREAIEAYEDELASGDHVLLRAVEAYGSAWGLVDGELTVALAVAARDDGAAAANEDLFGRRFGSASSPVTDQPYADSLDLVRSEVEGSVTVFWFEGDKPDFFLSALFRRDPVVATGG